MINKNIPLNNRPFLLKPVGKDYLWGGNRLNQDFGKEIQMNPLAETWECSTHPDGPSVVASGMFEGQTLSEVIRQNPAFLGSHPKTKGELPILIKFIDAKQNLSVQVHPDDAYAQTYENGALGKTEMWYVLDAAKDASVIYGLRWDVDRETLRRSVETGTIRKYLQHVEIKKDDIFYIEAGTIHAIGAGALIAEIQENSNLTYRLYDYDRLDAGGYKRPLHVEKALEVANLKSSTEPVQPMRILRYRPGCASEFLCRCPYFQVERLLFNTERCREMVSLATGGMSFQVLLVLSGCGILFFEDETISFYKGDCIFIPANSVNIKIHGSAQMLKVSC